MKTTAEYISILRDYVAKNAGKYHITRMGIFGSVARGEQTEGSDVDIYLEAKPVRLGTYKGGLAETIRLRCRYRPLTQAHGRFPEKQDREGGDLCGMRDIIAHHYFDIDADIIFDVMKNNLPAVRLAVNRMIENL